MPDFEKERVFYYFNQVSMIPRESGNEKGISDWITAWAKEKALDAIQDEAFNVIIKKAASDGYENAAPVILQAHMDMVCEKMSDSTHNFDSDPIRLKTEGDWLTSACGTSLGADNGIGVACAMAVLEDDSLSHPALEVVFTVEEETTFKGAETVSAEHFTAERMINLDHADDLEIIAGSCGGTGVSFGLPLSWEEAVPDNWEAYKIKLRGMKGGHSGEDIHRGRGNAINLLIRILDDADIRTVSIEGGTNRLAIPREAEAVVLARNAGDLQGKVLSMKRIFRKEYGEAAPDLDIALEKVAPVPPLKRGEFEKLAAAVKLIPNGIVQMNGELEGVVESSNNIGIIKSIASEGKMVITCEVRGMYQSTIDDIKRKIELLGGLLGAQVGFFTPYTSWEYAKSSQLRQTAVETYKELYGEKMKVLALHAGLECGMFVEKKPGMDVIAIGPTCQFFHSPNERVSISSVRKFYKFLTELLTRLK